MILPRNPDSLSVALSTMAFILWSVARVQDNGSGLATAQHCLSLPLLSPSSIWNSGRVQYCHRDSGRERAPEFGRGAGHSVFVPSLGNGTGNLEKIYWDYHSEILLAKFPLVLEFPPSIRVHISYSYGRFLAALFTLKLFRSIQRHCDNRGAEM